MIGWLDCSTGASGDMVLGALLGAGVPLDVMNGAVGALGLPVSLAAERSREQGLACWRVRVEVGEVDSPRRSLLDVRRVIDAADLGPALRDRVLATFARLGEAESVVHGVAAEEVHFHEVGALDAIADVVGACAGLSWLGLDALHASVVALGAGRTGVPDSTVAASPGTTRRASAGPDDVGHGSLTMPAPAVLELLRAAGAPSHGGPAQVELCTPTGAALLGEWVSSYGAMPALTPSAIGVGAGGRRLARGLPNVLRLVVGPGIDPAESSGSSPAPAAREALVVEANVDDLDPRIWPGVLARLLDVGALDAWLTPIIAKKGRPAHIVHALTDPVRAGAVHQMLYAETTTIGLREHPVARRPLRRTEIVVDVGGQPVRVKLAWLADRVINAGPEYDDVAAAAAALERPVKELLAEAAVAARQAAGELRAGQTAGSLS